MHRQNKRMIRRSLASIERNLKRLLANFRPRRYEKGELTHQIARTRKIQRTIALRPPLTHAPVPRSNLRSRYGSLCRVGRFAKGSTDSIKMSRRLQLIAQHVSAQPSAFIERGKPNRLP